jgi:hypothetical protein
MLKEKFREYNCDLVGWNPIQSGDSFCRRDFSSVRWWQVLSSATNQQSADLRFTYGNVHFPIIGTAKA